MRSKTAPRGGPWGRRGGFCCYLDNIEITEANRETFLFIYCLRAMRELNGVPYSAAIRLAVLAYYQDKFATPSAQKK